MEAEKSFEELVEDMVDHDLLEAEKELTLLKDGLIKPHGKIQLYS